VNPRNTNVLVGSSNDYCPVYSTVVNGVPVALGPIWLGYYRSENGGASFQSSLVPGYPGDVSPFAALAQIRTASAGDPVITWDNHGRVFFGSESSGDPAGTLKTFGDEWVARFENPDGEGGNTINDGKAYRGTTRVAKGSSAPNLLGVFHDKTSIQADRTGGPCDGNVYFSWSCFTGGKNSNVYLVRSISCPHHGVTFSNPILITSSIKNVQDPDISVTGNGHVYVTFDEFETNSGQPFAVAIAKSTDCGQTFSKPQVVTTFIPYVPLEFRRRSRFLFRQHRSMTLFSRARYQLRAPSRVIAVTLPITVFPDTPFLVAGRARVLPPTSWTKRMSGFTSSMIQPSLEP
jgi:hypothetical protein